MTKRRATSADGIPPTEVLGEEILKNNSVFYSFLLFEVRVVSEIYVKSDPGVARTHEGFERFVFD